MDEAVAAEAAVRAGPVPSDRRIESVDVLRGVAVLGILAINIFAFGLPHMAYINPRAAGGFEGIDRTAWWATFLLFNFKMMPVFSMLFGAGVVMMGARFRESGPTLRAVWYRRMLWLTAIGALHGYLLWVGDILFLYGVCGMAVYPLRFHRPRVLALVAIAVFSASTLALTATGWWYGSLRGRMTAIEEKLERGENLSRGEESTREQWDGMRKNFEPTPGELRELREIYRDGYAGIVRYRAPLYLSNTTVMLLLGSFWPTAALMLAGMALLKTGVFAAARSRRFYVVMAAIGYCAGLPLAWRAAHGIISHEGDMARIFSSDMVFNHFAGPLVALGHVALVMLFVRGGVLRLLRRALSSAGRMAFSNYLGQSVICTTFFFGYGFGFYDTLGKAELMGVVVAVWTIQLVVSLLWLSRFRFGPAEWLWRSLTYRRRQPMLGSPRSAV